MTDFEKALLLSELEKAARQCAKGLTYKGSVSGYLIDSLCKNSRLRGEIITGTYKTSKYLIFWIFEPKKRRICATRFRDRVWQKSMVNNGVRKQLLAPLIYDNGACQENAGVDFAVDRMIMFLQEFYRKHGSNEGYCDHLDVVGFFPNTPHSESKRVVYGYVRDPMFQEEIRKVIDSFEDIRPQEEIQADPFGERGTALGSEISQLLQLAVPTHIDHAIKERFRIRAYIRFNDDMWIVSDDKEELRKVREFIIAEYSKMGLTVKAKQKNTKLRDGIKFLKKRIILTDTGKVVVKADPKKFGKERRVLKKMKEKLDRDEITMDRIREHYQSVKAGLDRCDEKAKVKALDEFYEQIFGQPPPELKKKNKYSKSKRDCTRKRGAKSEKRNRTNDLVAFEKLLGKPEKEEIA